jgi:hypothetical protein
MFKRRMNRIRCPRYKTLTINESHVQGWCKVCKKKPCVEFDPVDFAEFAGRKGIDALIVEREGQAAFLLAPMPGRKFRILMQEYMREKTEVR